MTAFLYLQRFDNGQPAGMPYADVMTLLARHGSAWRTGGDPAFTFADGSIASACAVIGDADTGVVCIAFERPRYDATLRALVWSLMERLGCAVFDDALHLVNLPLAHPQTPPAALVQACINGVRRIDSPLQLWPGEFEAASGTVARPALRYTDADGAMRLHYFDSVDLDHKVLTTELALHPAACNGATVRVLRNLECWVDAAMAANRAYRPRYHYLHAQAADAVLAAPPLRPSGTNATVTTPARPAPAPGFVMDREVYAVAAAEAAKMTQHVLDKYKLALDGSTASVNRLALVLDKLHAFYRQAPQASASCALALRWAETAGSYLGMVIVRQVGGQWGYVLRGEQRLLAVLTHRGALVFPHLLVLDHIINRGSDNVAQRLRALAERGASPCPRKDDFACSVPVLCALLRAPGTPEQPSDLPLPGALEPARLDFSLDSLHHLDRYLAAVAAARDNLEPQAVARMVLAAGAYLGEVVRNNAPAAERWRWRNYDDIVLADPAFAQRQPRQPGVKAVLDSDAQMSYPLAQVALALRGAPDSSVHSYALQLLGAAPTAAPQARENAALA